MKTNLFAAIITACLSLAFFTGCATRQAGSTPPIVQTDTNGMIYVFGSAVAPSQVNNITKLAAVAGATAAIKYDPNSKAYLQAAAAVFNATLDSGSYDPKLMEAALSKLSVNGASDPNVVAGVNLSLATYSAIFSATIQQKIGNANIYLIPALTGLRDGIIQVVGIPTAPPAANSP